MKLSVLVGRDPDLLPCKQPVLSRGQANWRLQYKTLSNSLFPRKGDPMSLWPELEKLQSATWVDLTHPLTDDSPYWAGIPEGSVELCRTVFDYDEEMLSCRIHTYKFPGPSTPTSSPGSSARISTSRATSRRARRAPRPTASSRWPCRFA